MRWTRMILGVVSVGLVFAPAAQADTFTVAGTDDVLGVCAPTCASIRQALASAYDNPGPDTVVVPAGTYQLSNGALPINSPVTLSGAGARTTTIIANANARVLEISAAATVSDVTVRGGTATAAGGFHRRQHPQPERDRDAHPRARHRRIGLQRRWHRQPQREHADPGQPDRRQHRAQRRRRRRRDHQLRRRRRRLRRSSRCATRPWPSTRPGWPAASPATAAGSTTSRCTRHVARNTGTDRGIGGVAIEPGTGYARATLIADNTGNGSPSNCSQALTSNGWNVETGTNCGFTQEVDQPGVANAGLDCQLRNLGGPTDVLQLFGDSPAINVMANGCNPADQRGVIRPQGPACDAGAFELEYGPDRLRARRARRPTPRRRSPTPRPGRRRVPLPDRRRHTHVPVDCTAPASYTSPALADGSYTFTVEALVDAQVIGSATRSFSVDTAAPPGARVHRTGQQQLRAQLLHRPGHRRAVRHGRDQ